MCLKLCVCVFFVSTTLSFTVNSQNYNRQSLKLIPDYDSYNVINYVNTDRVRKNFMRKKHQNIKVGFLDSYISNNTIYVDGISHHKINKEHPQWKRVRKIEKDFKSLIAMKGVKYIYNRDEHWRTWREVDEDSGNKAIVCYRCENIFNLSCTDCHTSGYWVIEDGPPPCPFELFSVINNYELCGANYTQFTKDLESCPSIIKFSDLSGTCDNPIKTKWRFTPVFSISERHSKYRNDICKTRDVCEILTLYEISPKHVVFRIINSNYEIIYSRVMEDKKNNYACIDDCGRIDNNTMKFKKDDSPFSLNLLKSNKKKRDNSIRPLHTQLYTSSPVKEKKNKNYLPWLKLKTVNQTDKKNATELEAIKSSCKELLDGYITSRDDEMDTSDDDDKKQIL